MGGGGSKMNASIAGFSSSESTDRSSTPAPSQQDETSPGQHAGTSSDPVTRHDPNLQYCRVCGVSVPNTFTSAYQHWMGKRHRRKLRSASDSSLFTGRLRGRKRLRNQQTEKPSDTKGTHSPPNTREKQSSKAKKKGGTKKGKGKRKRKSSECSNSTESKRTRLQSDHEDPNSERTDFPKDVGPNSCRNSFPSLTDLSQLDGPSHVTAPPLPPDDVTHVIFVDLDNWSHFFQKLPHELPSGSFVYGFAGGCTTWREPKNCSALTALQQNGCFYMHPSCGRWKDAADFAICVHAGKLDERLPKEVPFTVLSGDKGFYELAHQLRISSRRAHIVNPHEHDMDMVLGLLNSIGET
ncbi:ZNF451 [Branchiostoma lanceolatum]|uniref:ZNF451 protein n=1 Tax=Branchiostoma lanceolatum TaxID=7740 RepID=A0A8J9VY17_BRALA|nr:ZNF451 [Branchiostoma lanceolatum]